MPHILRQNYGGEKLNLSIDVRVREIACFISANNATVRTAARQFGCSKSTVHKYMTEYLEALDPVLYEKVRRVLDQNKAERHIRGGLATKQKYLSEGIFAVKSE